MQKNGVRTAITANGDANIDISDVQNVVHNVWGVFLNHQRISILIDTAFFFMTLNTDHLQEWSADPESFYIARSNSVADDDVLACAQNLYLSLCEAESSQETIVKKVVSIMENTEAQMAAIRIEAGNIIDNSSSTGFVGGQSVLQWDTIYTAVGLSLSIIEKRSQLNLKAWLECVVRYLKIITGRKNIVSVLLLFAFICYFNYGMVLNLTLFWFTYCKALHNVTNPSTSNNLAHWLQLSIYRR